MPIRNVCKSMLLRRLVNYLGVAAVFGVLTVYSSKAAFAGVICVNVSVISIVFGSSCDPEEQLIEVPEEDIRYESYFLALPKDDQGEPIPDEPIVIPSEILICRQGYDANGDFLAVCPDSSLFYSLVLFSEPPSTGDDQNSVSEPSILGLLGLGIVGLALTRRKRRIHGQQH